MQIDAGHFRVPVSQTQELLDAGARAETAGRWYGSETGDDALSIYRGILDQDLDNNVALLGLRRVGDRLDVEAGAPERDREARAEGPGADDRRAPQRSKAAEPLPLQRHARPDAVRDGLRETLARLLDLRERIYPDLPLGPPSEHLLPGS